MADEMQHLKDQQRFVGKEQTTKENTETEECVMAPEGQEGTTTFAPGGNGIVTVGKDIEEQSTMDQPWNNNGNNPPPVELARFAPWEFHAESGLYEFNDEFYAIYGTSEAREGRFMPYGVYTREFVHPDDAWMIDAETAKVLSSAGRHYSGQLEHRIVRRNGEVRTIIMRSSIVKDDDGKIVRCFGANQDITEQKALEENLRISREKLSQAAELARLGPWEYNLEKNVFEFSDELCAIYGTSVAQEGRFMAPEVYAREFVHPEDAWVVEAEANRVHAYTGQHYTRQLEHRIIRRDGEVRTILVRINATRDAAGKIVRCFGANQDITEQKAMEEDLRIGREKLSQAVELARLGPWEFHHDKHLFEFNDEFYAIYGTSVAREGRFIAPEIYAREFVYPDDVWMVEAEVSKGLASTGPHYSRQVEHRIIRRDGEVRTIIVRINFFRDASGEKIKVFGVNQDITERVQAEQKLIESEKRLNATLNTLPDMLFRINAEGLLLDHRIPAQYARYLVRKIDKHDTVYAILPGQLTKLMKEMVNLSLHTGKTGMDEYIGQINGTECCLQIRTASINEKEALIIIQDQTELYKSRREFQRLDKLDLIGKMAAGIGHEVRNPLTTVRGYLQFLSSKALFQAHAEMFSLMIGELDRTNAIISEFLALSKNKMVRLEPKNLNSIVLAIYPLLAVDAIAENKSINLELDNNIPEVSLDESEIRQLIINFVRNGLEAMTNKGILSIRTWHDEQHVMLMVRDSGTGIPAGIIDKIGTPFVTTKESGTGLGLSVCYSIAARHKATIDFNTGKNGTEFTVRFKLSETF